jgi:hypothetical protein
MNDHLRVPTVIVDTDNGPVTINEEDFDAKTMKIHKPTKAEQKIEEQGGQSAADLNAAIAANTAADAASVAPVTTESSLAGASAPEPAVIPEGATNLTTTGHPTAAVETSPPRQFATRKEGQKIVVFDLADGKPVTDTVGIDPKGYKNEGEAWAAITAIAVKPLVPPVTPAPAAPAAAGDGE